MQDKAEELLDEKDFSSEFLDANIFKPKQEKLINSLNNHIGHQSSNQIIIINCCYLFASYSLNVDELKEEIDTIILTTKTVVGNPKVVIIYQNPKGYDEKWKDFKNKMITFNSIENYPCNLPFSYNSATQSNRRFNFDVNVDIIKNY